MIDPPYPRLDVQLHRKVCHVLLEIRLRFPDLRLSQLIDNLATSAESNSWDVEDWDLLRAAECFLERHKDRIPDVGPPAATNSIAASNPDAA